MTLPSNVAAGLLAGAGIGQAATTPQNQFGIKLLQAPASEAGDPRANTYIIDHLNSGADIHRDFQVSNLGSNPVASACTRPRPRRRGARSSSRPGTPRTT